MNGYRRHKDRARDVLIDAVAYVVECDVAGVIVEFGIGNGDTMRALAEGVLLCSRRGLHLFDSMQGLPVEGVDTGAPHVVSGAWKAGKCRTGNTEFDYRKKLPPGVEATFYPGWFRDTVPGFSEACALVHVDSDLYSSAMDALGPLFERGLISRGCMILFDDWNCNRGSPRHGEQRAWRELVEKFSIESGDEGSYGVFAHKFLVHGYRGASWGT